MPVSEHDPVSNEVLRLLTAQPFLDPLTMGRITGIKAGPLIQYLAAELLAYREAARALLEAEASYAATQEHLRRVNDRADSLYRQWEIEPDDTTLQTRRAENLQECIRAAEINAAAARALTDAQQALRALVAKTREG